MSFWKESLFEQMPEMEAKYSNFRLKRPVWPGVFEASCDLTDL